MIIDNMDIFIFAELQCRVQHTLLNIRTSFSTTLGALFAKLPNSGRVYSKIPFAYSLPPSTVSAREMYFVFQYRISFLLKSLMHRSTYIFLFSFLFLL